MLLLLFSANSNPGINGAGVVPIAINGIGTAKLSIFGNCATVINIFLQAYGAKDGALQNNNQFGMLQSTLAGIFRSIVA